jgi:hypothetical protein
MPTSPTTQPRLRARIARAPWPIIVATMVTEAVNRESPGTQKSLALSLISQTGLHIIGLRGTLDL